MAGTRVYVGLQQTNSDTCISYLCVEENKPLPLPNIGIFRSTYTKGNVYSPCVSLFVCGLVFSFIWFVHSFIFSLFWRIPTYNVILKIWIYRWPFHPHLFQHLQLDPYPLQLSRNLYINMYFNALWYLGVNFPAFFFFFSYWLTCQFCHRGCRVLHEVNAFCELIFIKMGSRMWFSWKRFHAKYKVFVY